MAIKVIVELQAKPGRRDELKRVLESLIATQGPGQGSFVGSTRYGVLDDPGVLVEVADWESLRRGRPTCRKLRARRHLCASYWPPRSGPRPSARSLD